MGWLGDWENGMERVQKRRSLLSYRSEDKAKWHFLCSTHDVAVDGALCRHL